MDAFTGVRSSIAFTQSPAIARFGEVGKALVATAKHAYMDGFHAALLTAAAVLGSPPSSSCLRSPSGPAADPGTAHRTRD